MMQPVIEIKKLTKDYGYGRGIFDVDLTVYKGEMVGFVGTNGSGKTTTIRNILGFLRPTKGAAYVHGLEAWTHSSEIVKRIGYVPGEIAFPDLSTGTEFLKSQAGFLGVESMEYANLLIERLQLDPRAPLKRMSKGMKQKTAIVAALMANPEILVLDEPTAALDPIAESDIYQKYREMTVGRTSIYISHRLASTRFCDRILLLADGKIAEEGTHEALMAKGGEYARLFEIQSRYYREGGEDDGGSDASE